MNVLDRAVAKITGMFGTQAIIRIVTGQQYDTTTSQNVVTYTDYNVNVIIQDYLRKEDGLGAERNTLIQSGDKQVYVQPPQKIGSLPLPTISPNQDLFVFGGKVYKIVFLKQLNPSMSVNGCVAYELYIRE